MTIFLDRGQPYILANGDRVEIEVDDPLLRASIAAAGALGKTAINVPDDTRLRPVRTEVGKQQGEPTVPYEYSFDDTPIGDVRMPTNSYQFYQDGLKRLRALLQEWNAKSGTSSLPYRHEVEDLDQMIEWAESTLATGASHVHFGEVSRGSRRYLRAAADLMVYEKEQELLLRAAELPDGVRAAMARDLEAMRRQPVSLGNVEPADVLWEVIPRPASTTATGRVSHTVVDAAGSREVQWDAFICHASEDKEDFVRPLARALQQAGLRIWYDEFTLTVGDSLRRSIDRGLAHSQYGIVIISPYFMAKEWPQKELDGLGTREVGGGKVILPVWHGITADEVRRYSPMLADRVATSSARGLGQVVTDLLTAMRKSAAVGRPEPGAAEGVPAADAAEVIGMGARMPSAKPSYWTICLEYLREAYQARERGEDWTSSREVELRLGLSVWDELAYVQHLQRLGLIHVYDAIGEGALYRLSPEGQQRMEGLPALDKMLAESVGLIDAQSGVAPAQKEEAKVKLQEEAKKAVIHQGVGTAIKGIVELAKQLIR